MNIVGIQKERCHEGGSKSEGVEVSAAFVTVTREAGGI